MSEPGDDRIVSYRIAGPLFFGSTPRFGDVMSRIGIRPRVYLLDLTAVPLVDASGAEAIGAFARQAKGQQASVIVFGARPTSRMPCGMTSMGALLAFAANQNEARAAARRLLEA